MTDRAIRYCTLAAAAALLALLCSATMADQALAATTNLAPVADTSVRSDHPRARGGGARRLYVRARHPRRRAFLRFAVSVPARAQVTRATLRLRGVRSSGRPAIALRGVRSDAWSAARLDWLHQPRLGQVVDRVSRVVGGRRLSLDATHLVPPQGGRVAMALTVVSRNGSVAFASREAVSGRPQLIVRTAPRTGPTAPPPGSSVPPSSSPGPASRPVTYAWRGMYDREVDGTFSHIAAAGFNLIDSTPADVDELTGGVKGLTWVGDYDNTSCSWDLPDSTLESEVSAHRDDPRVAVWFISDEPDPFACPDAYAQHASRTALIHSIDPDTPTVVVMDSNDGRQTLAQMPGWRGAADIIALDPYPCHQDGPCRFDWIDTVVAHADAAGLPYWGVVQAFGDPPGGSWRLPTVDELHEEFLHWRASSMTGYLVFAWRWPSGDSGLWLANHPELQAQLRIENGG